MAIVGDIIQTVTTWRFTGDLDNIQNVFWFRVTVSGSGNPCTFIEATLRLNWMPEIAKILSDSIHLRGITCVNWRDPSEFLDEAYSEGVLNGDIPGDHLGDWITFNFSYLKDRPGHKPGLKQLSGVPEVLNVNGTLNSDYFDEMDGVEAVLESSFSSGGWTFQPVVVQRFINGVDVFPVLGTGTPQSWVPPAVVFSGFGHRDSRR